MGDMTYKHLGPAQQAQMIAGRRLQLEQEHFDHELNVVKYQALPEGTRVQLPTQEVVSQDQAIANARQQQAFLEAQVADLDAASDKLVAELPEDDVPTVEGTETPAPVLADPTPPAEPSDPAADDASADTAASTEDSTTA